MSKGIETQEFRAVVECMAEDCPIFFFDNDRKAIWVEGLTTTQDVFDPPLSANELLICFSDADNPAPAQILLRVKKTFPGEAL